MIYIPRHLANPPILDDEWIPDGWAVEADGETRRRRAKAFAAGREIRSDQRQVEARAVSSLLRRLEQLQGELTVALVNASDFRRFQVTALLQDVERLIDQARRDLVTLADGALTSAAQAGDAHGVEPVRAAGLSVDLPTGVDRVLVTAAFDATADLLSDTMRQFQTRLATNVRRVATTGENFATAMLDLSRNISDAGMANAEYSAERQLRTEVSRVFNVATFERMAALSDRVPALRKAWVRTNDGRTRETHNVAGRVYARDAAIPVRELFAVGKARMRFPVDPAAAPAGRVAAGETIMCRCNAVAEFDAGLLASQTQQRVSVALGRAVEPGPAPPVSAEPQRPAPREPRPFDPARVRARVLKVTAARRASVDKIVARRVEVEDEINRLFVEFTAKPYPSTSEETAEWRRRSTEIDALRRRLNVIRTEEADEREKMAARVRRLLSVPTKDRPKYKWLVDYKSAPKLTPLERRRYEDAMRDFERLIGLKTIGAAHDNGGEINVLVHRSQARAHVFDGRRLADVGKYKNLKSRRHLVESDRYTAGRVIVHELGHTLEFDDPRVLQSALDFLDRRTKGDRLRKLNAIQPNRRYKADEYAKEDKFIEPYMGKVYSGRGATELVSMGVEYLYAEPWTLAERDPDFFDWITSLLRGIY